MSIYPSSISHQCENILHYESSPWTMDCLPGDGGRISRLRYQGQSLLTEAPSEFTSPGQAWGRYETRPVYGYDDCLPTVDPCKYPDGMDIPDHGEVCWLPWQMQRGDNRVEGQVQCRILPLRFYRQMHFHASGIEWQFDVENTSLCDISFLHVMHAMLPVREITRLRLPAYTALYDEISRRYLDFSLPQSLSDELPAAPQGTVRMLLLENVQSGCVEIVFNRRYRLTIRFDHKAFPTLGIWWNNGGYPDKDACCRFECAFEPIPGMSSSLSQTLVRGATLAAPAQGKRSWAITWEITQVSI